MFLVNHNYLLGYFMLSKETWWAEYFAPLERWIAESGTSHADDPKTLEQLHQAQLELDMFNRNPERNSSVYFAMKKR
jgi:hypothetical protein